MRIRISALMLGLCLLTVIAVNQSQSIVCANDLTAELCFTTEQAAPALVAVTPALSEVTPQPPALRPLPNVERLSQVNPIQVPRPNWAAPLGVTAAFTDFAWQSIGPGNIAGPVRALAIDPQTPATMYVGGVTGGIWKSTDAGASWQSVNDTASSLAISALVIDPLDQNVIYAGTGDIYWSLVRGAGILKSSDGGTTWTTLPGTEPNPDDPNDPWSYVNRLTVAPDDSAILAATWKGIFRSDDEGATWERTLDSSLFSSQFGVLDVDFDPNDPNRVIAASNPSYVWYSADNGQTWTISFGLDGGNGGRAEIAWAPSDDRYVYAAVDTNGGQLWISSDWGKSFTLLNDGQCILGLDQGGGFCQSIGWYSAALWVSPVTTQTIVVGAMEVVRSIDGGQNFEFITDGFDPASPAFYKHALVSHPDFNGLTTSTIYVGTDSGLFATDDIFTATTSAGWRPLNTDLNVTQLYGVSGNATSGKIVAGAQGGGTLLYDGDANNWQRIYYGYYSGFVIADPSDPNYFYGQDSYLAIHRSADGGATVEDIYGQVFEPCCSDKNPPYIITETLLSLSNFVVPMVLDPNNPERMLVGGMSLWQSNDIRATNTISTGPQWRIIKPVITLAENVVPIPSKHAISAIAVAPGNSDLIWVGHNNGHVYRTTDGTTTTPTWTRVDTGLPDRYVSHIAIDPLNTNRVYVSFGKFDLDSVWRTDDGGFTWRGAYGQGGVALPTSPIYGLAIHPTRPDWLVVGTEVGVYVSGNRGGSWALSNLGLSHIAVNDLAWAGPTRLIAATNGRGAFMAEVDPSVLSQLFGIHLPMVRSDAPPPTPTPTRTPLPTNTPTPTRTPIPATATSTPTAGPAGQVNLAVSSVKILQGITMDDARAVYIAGRKTLVRVFVGFSSSNGSTSVGNVTGRLTRFVSGIEQDSLTPTGSIVAVQNPSEGNLAQTLNFELPDTWLVAGTEYVLTLDPDNAVNESNESDNRFPASGTQSFNFQTTRSMEIVIVPVRYNGPGGKVSTPKTDDLSYLTWMPAKVYPVPQVNYTVHAEVTFNGDLDCFQSNCGWSAFLTQITNLQASEDPGETKLYYGLINQADFLDCSQGCSAIVGLGWVGQTPASVGSTGLFLNGDDGSSPVLVHEAGHNLNRKHSPCGGGANPDAAYPYSGGNTGQWGYDYDLRTLYPPSFSDYMSYCQSDSRPYQWTSDFTYKNVFDYRQANTYEPPAAPVEALFINGQISGEGLVTLQPIYRHQAPADTVAYSDYKLELVDEQGAVLGAHYFETAQIAEMRQLKSGRMVDGTWKTQGFAFHVPAVEGVARVRFYYRGALIHEQGSAAALAPLIVTLNPEKLGAVAWSAAATTPLMYRVRFSADGGHTWQTLAVNQSAANYTLTPAMVVRAAQPIVEVQATDGIRTVTKVLPVVYHKWR